MTARDPVRRSLLPVTLGMRHVAFDREFVAGLQVTHVVADGQPHLAFHDDGPDRERMRVRRRGVRISHRAPRT